MDSLNLFTKMYGYLRNYGMPKWIMTPPRKIIRRLANWYLPKYLSKACENNNASKENIIVSFTSFPARIKNVWQVVECMKRQSLQPSKVILWLSKNQFPIPESIPKSLREREGFFFEIRFVEGDIRSHKKYYYVSKEYPNSLVFLIDDDIYYPTTIIERTMRAHQQYPNAVICNYGYHIGCTKHGIFLPYNSWPREYHYSSSYDLFFGSGGGTLIKPEELHEELTNIEQALELAPTADDIWLNAVVKISKKPVVLLENGMVLPIHNLNNENLASSNKGLSHNDKQLEAVWKYMSKYQISI